jgi:hypothetical protein
MEQETQKILEMLRDGKITSEEAERLLEALDAAEAATPRRGKPRLLRINVTDMRTGRNTVNIGLPFGLVEVASRMGLSLGVKSAPELANVNFDEIIDAIRSGVEGKILDIEDENDRQHVTISVD